MTKCNLDISNLRSPNDVMTLRRLGAMFPHRLSFLRVLLRRLMSEKAALTVSQWDMNQDGFGTAVLTVPFGGHTYSLIAVTQHLDPENRSDRVIAEQWDAAFCLFDGIPTAEDRARIAENAPRQEAGRFGPKELVLSRANKSVRLFEHVVTALKDGSEIDVNLVQKCGYLMRTTAVYGNGKFGIADRADFADRPGLSGPFMVEMLTVWMIREFTHKLVAHIAGKPMPKDLRLDLGIGNSTGLGMAPFLVHHPLLLHSWIAAKETALANALGAKVTDDKASRLVELAGRVTLHLSQWNVPDVNHQSRIEDLRQDWRDFTANLAADDLTQPKSLEKLLEKAREKSADLEELTVSWIIEVSGDLVDELAECMANPFLPELDASISCATMMDMIETHADFVQNVDFTGAKATQQFWYVSEAKLEPRLGNRHEEPGGDLESPLDIARRIQSLYHALEHQKGPLWAFLAVQPEHRFAVERVQALAANPYSEIRENLIDADMAPIDMLRCKLSFFGASKFDPKSQLWTRITLAQGAPLAEDIATGEAKDDWWLPVFAA